MFKYEFDNYDRWRVYNQANSYEDDVGELLDIAKGNFGELVFYRWCRAHLSFDRWHWNNRYKFNRGVAEFSSHDFKIDKNTVDVKTRTDLGKFGSSMTSDISSDTCVVIWLQHKKDDFFGEAADNYQESIEHIKNGVNNIEIHDEQGNNSVEKLAIRATSNMECLSDDRAVLIGYSDIDEWKDTSCDGNSAENTEYVNIEHPSSLINSHSDINEIYHKYSFGDIVTHNEYEGCYEVYELPLPAHRYEVDSNQTTVADKCDCDPEEPYIGIIPLDVGPNARYAVPPAIDSSTIQIEPIKSICEV